MRYQPPHLEIVAPECSALIRNGCKCALICRDSAGGGHTSSGGAYEIDD